MTVTNTYTPSRTVCDGVQKKFLFNFKTFSAGDLEVYLVDRATSVKTLQTLTTHYTVTIYTATEGGEVDFVSAPASTNDVLITRAVDLVQPTSIPDVGTFFKTQLEKELDRSRMIDQQLQESLGRTLQIDIGDPTIPNIIPSLVAGGVLTNDGVNLVWSPIVSGMGNVPGAASPGDNGKFLQASGGGWTWQPMEIADLSDATAFGKSLLPLADVAAAKALLGLDYSDIIPGYRSGFDYRHPGGVDILVDPGMVVDTTNVDTIELTTQYTKKVDAAWAAGSGQGLLDTGVSPTNSTWYYLWAIKRSDTGVVDILGSASNSSPTMPTNYDRKRRIGQYYIDSGGNVKGFRKIGDTTWFNDPVVAALNEASIVDGNRNWALSVPVMPSDTYRPATGPVVIVRAVLRDATSAGTALVLVYSKLDTNTSVTSNAYTLAALSATGFKSDAETLLVQADSIGEIRTNHKDCNQTDIFFDLQVLGFIDPFRD